MTNRESAPPDDFTVDPFTHALGGLVERFPRLFERLGRIETRMLADRLPKVVSPVYIAGLARAGSTLLLELFAWHDGVVTHRYRDFPMLHVPFFWNRFLDYATKPDSAPRERAHRDGIQVTRESPEAFEEVLWMSFFDTLHDPARSAVLDADTVAPSFERFYTDHIAKLLHLRGGTRYVSKGNYNVTRLEYLLEICPDARFVIPVREPLWHVASLMKQDALFRNGQSAHPRAITHLRRAGHFEFGVDRRVINAGDTLEARRITTCWREGREVEGWARCWNLVYGYVAQRLDANPALAAASLLLPFESLCRQPAQTTRTLFEHCGFTAEPALIERARERIRFPAYYTPSFTAEERDDIERLTAATAERLRRHAAGAAAVPAAS